MENHAKAYGMFLVFTVLTSLVVKPIVTNLNIPILSTAL